MTSQGVDPLALAGRSRLARWVSIVLHPFLMLSTLALLASWQRDRDAFVRTAAGMVVVIAMAWAFVAWRKRSGRWTTVDASKPHERPMLYGVLLALLLGYWAWMGGPTSPATRGIVIVAAMLCAAAVLNRWIKLSLHMASLAFTGVAALVLVPPLAIAALALLPVLAWARLRMQRHTWPEVIGGTFLGMAFGTLAWWPA